MIKGIGSDEGIVLAGKLLDQLLVLVELLQVVRRHGINTTVLGTIDIMLVTQDAVSESFRQASFLILMQLGVEILIRDRSYQTVMPGLGTRGSLTVPEKRLSR